jgi:amino acid adenylation domain-containing protein
MLVQHFLEQAATRQPEKTALVCDDRRLSYAELDSRAACLAGFLVAQGVRRHDRVAIFLENSPEAVISLFAILKAGAVFVLLNPGMKAKKLNFILNDCGARALVADLRYLPVVGEAAGPAPELRCVIWCGAASVGEKLLPGKVEASWEMAVDSPPGKRGAQGIDIDMAAIIYTSGSTGEPKGVVAAHSNMVAVMHSITTYLHNTEDDIVLNALPLSYGYGLYQVLTACQFGGTVVLEKSFGFPHRILQKMAAEKVTGLPIVPTMVSLLLKMADPSRFELSSLRYLTNAAAALPVAHIQRLRALLPQVQIYSMYGLTECTRASYLPPEEIGRRPTSVGIPIPNEEVFVVNDRGEEVGPGEIGELVVRGQNVMQGYWNRPEETACTFRRGRWPGETLLYTGDLFRRDAEGFLYFVARNSDLIKTRGELVSPREIENVLCDLDGVAEAAVVGVPDELLGQAIKAYVVPTPGRSLREEEILKGCTRQLENFMVPKIIEFCDALPKLACGKVDKKSLCTEEPRHRPSLSAELPAAEPGSLTFFAAAFG